MLTIKRKHFAKFSAVIRDRYHSAFLKLHDRSERSTANDLARYFKLQEQDIQRRLREQGLPITAEMLFDPQMWEDRLKELMRLHLYRAAYAGAILELKAFGKSAMMLTKRDEFELETDEGAIDDILVDLPPQVQVAIRDATTETLAQPYWGNINATTASRLTNTISSSLDAGLNAVQMSGAIRDVLGTGTSRARAVMVARTEVTGALNAGVHSVQQTLQGEGLVTGKEWLATVDSFTRDSHNDASSQQVAVNDKFMVGGWATPYPGHHSLPAAERVNCRCTTISVTIVDDDQPPRPLAPSVQEPPKLPPVAPKPPKPAVVAPPVPKPKPRPKPKPVVAPPTPATISNATPRTDSLAPRFQSEKEAKQWLKDNHFDSVRLGRGMSKDQLQDVADGTSRVLGHNGNRVSLVGTHTSRSSLAYYEHTPRPSGGAYKNDVMKVQTAYSKDPIGNAARERAVFAERKARTIANADKHSADQSVDPAVRKKMEQKRENALATERWTVASDSKNPLAATFSHESGHTIMAQGIDSKTGMTIRSKFDERMLIAENLGHVTKQHKFSVSAYGATSNSEMFAEVTSAIADGRPHLVPKGILDVYNATLENYSIVK